jgi:hypothetical protein
MHRTDFAEFLLSRFTTRECAATIVGDLMEIDSSPFRFWSSLSRITIALFARSWLAVLAAAGGYSLALYLPGWGAGPISGFSRFFLPWMMLLSMIAVYSAVRRGLKDLVTGVATAMLALSIVAVLLRSVSWVPVACGLFAVLFAVVLTITAQGRKTLLSIILAVIAAIGGGWMVWQLAGVFDPRQESALGRELVIMASAASIALALPPSPSGIPGRNSHRPAAE